MARSGPRKFAMKQHILITKLQCPPVAPDILPRTHLLDRLNEGRWRPLTLISAPGGYGKSTLASRWVAACDSPSGWLSVDKSENDLRTFLSYFLAAIRSLLPDSEMRTEALLEANQLPTVSDLSRNLLNDLVFGPDSDAYTYTEWARRKAAELPAESDDSSTLNG